MAHPFHARLATKTTTAPAASAASRRTFIGWLAAAVGGVTALATVPAQAQRGRTMFRRPQPVTTQALGEEGSRRPFPQPPRYTTQALGEEGGRYTTYATGEEGGARITTYAVGEEGGVYYRPAPPPRPRGGMVTTYALGEEG